MVDNLLEAEKLVEKHIKEKNREAAVELLFDLIVRSARRRDFLKAEALRQKLTEVDAMALKEIVKSGEVIQEEQDKAIDHDHLRTWSNLYGTLTKEERNALYFSLQEEAYPADQFVFKQGEKNTKLYFIVRGSLSLIYHREEGDALLKALSTGDVAGEDTCFSNTVCTTSLITLSTSKLYALEREAMERWQVAAPALESKLCHYCERLERIQDLLERKGLDRRTGKRASLLGRGFVQLLSTSGRGVGRAFKVRLVDISPGGLSFLYRISRKETAQLLLGRSVNVKLHDLAGKEKLLDQNGTVVAVRPQPFEDYSVHVKFDGVLDDKTFGEIVRLRVGKS